MSDPIAAPLPVSAPELASRRRVHRRSDGSWALARAVTDAAMLTAAAAVSGVAAPDALGAGWYLALVLITLGLLVGTGSYAPGLALRQESWRLVIGVALTSCATAALALAFEDRTGAGDAAVLHWLVSSTLLLTGRVVVSGAQQAVRGHGRTGSPTLIVGAGLVGHTIAKRLREDPSLRMRPVGFLDKPSSFMAEEHGLEGLPVLGASWNLEQVLDEHAIEHVVIGFTNAPTPIMLDLVRRCWRQGVDVKLVPRLFEIEGRRTRVDHLGALPLISVAAPDPRSLQFSIKYALDRVVAALVLAVVSPLLAAIALAVLITMGRPVTFRQRRVGLDGRPFEMVKFRTMHHCPEGSGEADEAWAARTLGLSPDDVRCPDDDRRTPLGRFLRTLSLDELPQLANVLRGEMSLVGPRPERVHFVERFEDAIYRYPERHRVKAGLTGWAQVHGLRGETSLADRIEWDNFYIENWSPWLDLKILAMTIPAVVRRRGG